jgi:hypothetical protein
MMVKIITPNDLETNDNETRTSWRLLNADTLGSAFVIPRGVRHSIWGASAEEPVQAFYVSLKR